MQKLSWDPLTIKKCKIAAKFARSGQDWSPTKNLQCKQPIYSVLNSTSNAVMLTCWTQIERKQLSPAHVTMLDGSQQADQGTQCH